MQAPEISSLPDFTILSPTGQSFGPRFSSARIAGALHKLCIDHNRAVERSDEPFAAFASVASVAETRRLFRAGSAQFERQIPQIGIKTETSLFSSG